MRCSKPKSLFYALFLAFGATALTACSSTTTAAKLKDPSQAALSFRRAGRAAVRPIEPGTADVSTNLSGLGVKTPSSLRREGQAISLECTQCESGNVTLLSEAGLTAAAPTSVSALTESKKAQKGQLALEYQYKVTSSYNLNPVLETKWSNVEYFEEIGEPNRAWGWMLVPGGFLTVAGVFLCFQSPAAGIAVMVPGLALDTWGVWQLVMKPSTERLDAEGKPLVIASAVAAPVSKEAENRSAQLAKDVENESAEEEGAKPKPAEKAEATDQKAVSVPSKSAEGSAKESESEAKPAKASKTKPSQADDGRPSTKENKPSQSPSKNKDDIDEFLLL